MSECNDKKTSLLFKPIDLLQTRDLCVQFRKDSFIASFGSDEKTWPQAFDANMYLEWLENKQKKDLHAAVHVWLDDKIIGQLELGSIKDHPTIGYVSLYYLIPDYRGQGYSAALENHATQYLLSKGYTTARLTVSPTNLRALSFYKKNGWMDLGPREGHQGVHLMEKSLK